MFGTLAAFALLAAAPSANADVELEDYVVREGDSCARIAARRLGGRRNYPIIHVHNDLGPMPHQLKPGTVLRLPKKSSSNPDAELTHTRRVVQARSPKEADWSRAQRGLDLYRGWRVNTLDRSAAEVTFADDTKIQLRENTLVIIYGASRAKARRKTTTARLDRGALRSNLAALSGTAKIEVETPSAHTKLQGGAALVTVDEAGTSRIANHGDGSASVSSKRRRRRRVRVGRGMGSKVAKGKEPTPPKPLPATPKWAEDLPATFVVPTGGGGTLRGEWKAVARAEAYRVEVGRNVEGGFVSATVVVPKAVTDFEIHNVPPGEHFAIVSAVDDDKFESIPSRMHKMALLEAQLGAAAGTAVDVPPPDDEAKAPEPIAVLVGTTLTAPAGLRCAFGDAEPEEAPRVQEAGEQAVRCVDDTGAEVPGFAVVAHGLAFDPVGSASSIHVRPGETTRVEIHLDSPVGVPSQLEAQASKGLTVSNVQISSAVLSFDLAAKKSAPKEGAITFATPNSDTDVGQVAVVVSRVKPPTDEAEEPVKWIKRWAPTRNLVELGIFGGVLAPHRRLELFDVDANRPDAGFRRFPAVAGLAGARVGYGPLPFLALELDGGVSPTQVANTPVLVWGFSGSVVGQLGLWSVTPYVLFGGGAIGVSSPPEIVGSDVDPSIHFGGGLKLFLTRRLMLRLDVRDRVSSALGLGRAPAHSVEATLGIGLTLNRPKRK